MYNSSHSFKLLTIIPVNHSMSDTDVNFCYSDGIQHKECSPEVWYIPLIKHLVWHISGSQVVAVIASGPEWWQKSAMMTILQNPGSSKHLIPECRIPSSDSSEDSHKAWFKQKTNTEPLSIPISVSSSSACAGKIFSRTLKELKNPKRNQVAHQRSHKTVKMHVHCLIMTDYLHSLIIPSFIHITVIS